MNGVHAIDKLNIKRNASNYPYLKSISIDGEEIKGFSPTITQYIYDTLKEKVDNL